MQKRKCSLGLDSLFKGCSSSVLQTPSRATIETTCHLGIPPRAVAHHKYPPPSHPHLLPTLFFFLRSTTWRINSKKTTNGLKASFLTHLFCPGKIAKLKGGHCRDHPQTPTWQPRTAFPHATRGTSALYPGPFRGAHSTLKSSTRTVLFLVRICCPDLGSLGHKTRVILSHFRQPVTACILPPTERNDRNNGKSSPTISDRCLQSDDDSSTASAPS